MDLRLVGASPPFMTPLFDVALGESGPLYRLSLRCTISAIFHFGRAASSLDRVGFASAVCASVSRDSVQFHLLGPSKNKVVSSPCPRRNQPPNQARFQRLSLPCFRDPRSELLYLQGFLRALREHASLYWNLLGDLQRFDRSRPTSVRLVRINYSRVQCCASQRLSARAT